MFVDYEKLLTDAIAKKFEDDLIDYNNDNYFKNETKNYFEKEFYKWIKQNPDLLIRINTANGFYLHFGLGGGIRDHYFNSGKIYKDVPTINDFPCPDDYSDKIIDYWQELAIKIQEGQTKYIIYYFP
jgi:hypothetical protein